jgi:Ca-activated chloride channel homolog
MLITRGKNLRASDKNVSRTLFLLQALGSVALRCQTRSPRRCGATLVLITILLPVVFILAGFAINLSYMQFVQTRAQLAADAAAGSAGRVFAITGNQAAAIQAARDVAARNPIANKVLPLEAIDFEFGTSTRSSLAEPYVFTPGPNGNSVRLTTHSLASGVGGDIDPLFPLFGSVIQIRPLRSSTCTQLDLDIALVIDRSGSMAYSSNEISMYPPKPLYAPTGWVFGDPVPPNARWLDAIAAVQVFIGQLNDSPQNELLSLSVYNHAVSTPQPLTSNYLSVVSNLMLISSNFGAGGTNIGDGIREGIGALSDPTRRRPWATPVIIVLTDGVHNYGTHPVSAAHEAAENKVTVFTLTFSDEAEQGLMEQVASIGGGKHYHAVTAAQLQAAFREIAGRLPTLITK